MTVAERMARFVSESSKLGDASVKFLKQFESELHAGRIAALAIEAGPVDLCNFSTRPEHNHPVYKRQCRLPQPHTWAPYDQANTKHWYF